MENDTEQLYSDFLDDAEKEVSAICGHTPDEASRNAGRGEGPKFVWKYPRASKAEDHTRTTCISRAWRKVARWFKELLVARTETIISALHWNLLFYTHPLPPYPNEHQAMDILYFKEWMAVITTIGLMRSLVWLEALADCAQRFADATERDAETAARNKWTSWPQEATPFFSYRNLMDGHPGGQRGSRR